jgi:hypothetical protein
MAKSPPAVLIALESFVGEVDGERLTIFAGDAFEAEHPMVKQAPNLFGPLVFRYPIRNRIEQATAAPGEKRGK